jgi:hypothetical protein
MRLEGWHIDFTSLYKNWGMIAVGRLVYRKNRESEP